MGFALEEGREGGKGWWTEVVTFMKTNEKYINTALLLGVASNFCWHNRNERVIRNFVSLF